MIIWRGKSNIGLSDQCSPLHPVSYADTRVRDVSCQHLRIASVVSATSQELTPGGSNDNDVKLGNAGPGENIT